MASVFYTPKSQDTPSCWHLFDQRFLDANPKQTTLPWQDLFAARPQLLLRPGLGAFDGAAVGAARSHGANRDDLPRDLWCRGVGLERGLEKGFWWKGKVGWCRFTRLVVIDVLVLRTSFCRNTIFEQQIRPALEWVRERVFLFFKVAHRFRFGVVSWCFEFYCGRLSVWKFSVTAAKSVDFGHSSGFLFFGWYFWKLPLWEETSTMLWGLDV